MNPADLPNDVQRLIFTSAVDRAALCSVSRRWCISMIAVSKYYSPVPLLYSADIKRINIKKMCAVPIFKDYHLTCRLHPLLQGRAREMGIAANYDVIVAFGKYVKFAARDAILSRDPSITALYPYLSSNDYELFAFMLGDFSDLLIPENIGVARGPDRDMLQRALTTKCSTITWQWVINHAIYIIDKKLLGNIAKLPNADELLLMYVRQKPEYYDEFISVASFELIMLASHEGLFTLDEALMVVFDEDNIELFDKLVACGADPGLIDFYCDGVERDVKQCLMRIAPTQINKSRLINHIAACNNEEYTIFIGEHFQFGTSDYNNILTHMIKHAYNLSQYVIDHADNYDRDMYETHGILVLVKDVYGHLIFPITFA